MTDFCPLRSRLTGSLATRDDADYTTGATAFNLAIKHAPVAVEVRHLGGAMRDDVGGGTAVAVETAWPEPTRSRLAAVRAAHDPAGVFALSAAGR